MNSPLSRNVAPWLLELLSTFPAVEIVGARQVGKSTLATLVREQLRQPVRIETFDDPETQNAARLDPRGFVSLAGQGCLIIDEAQRVPELLLPLKAAIDADRTPGRYILTGSSKITTGDHASDSLAGRVASCELFGFSQGEFNQKREDFVSWVCGGIDPLISSDRTRAEYAEAIVNGSMPEVSQLTSPRLRRTWYQSYLDRVLTKDIQEVARVAQPEKIRSLLAELASVQGSEAVIGRLANDAHIPAATARTYMDHLRALHLISVIPPWTQNLLKREVGKPKIVLNDQGLAAHLTNSSAASLSDIVKGQAMGGFLEAFVGTELLKQRTWSDTEWSLSHYRSPDGREIDLVIECADGSVIGVEVKAAASVQSSDYKHLQWLREQIPDRFVAGLVLTTEGRGRVLDRRIYSLPVDTLWSV